MYNLEIIEQGKGPSDAILTMLRRFGQTPINWTEWRLSCGFFKLTRFCGSHPLKWDLKPGCHEWQELENEVLFPLEPPPGIKLLCPPGGQRRENGCHASAPPPAGRIKSESFKIWRTLSKNSKQVTFCW